MAKPYLNLPFFPCASSRERSGAPSRSPLVDTERGTLHYIADVHAHGYLALLLLLLSCPVAAVAPAAFLPLLVVLVVLVAAEVVFVSFGIPIFPLSAAH